MTSKRKTNLFTSLTKPEKEVFLFLAAEGFELPKKRGLLFNRHAAAFLNLLTKGYIEKVVDNGTYDQYLEYRDSCKAFGTYYRTTQLGDLCFGHYINSTKSGEFDYLKTPEAIKEENEWMEAFNH